METSPADGDMLRARMDRLVQKLTAEREACRHLGEEVRRQALASRLLASRLARLHACIMQEPDGGCGDVDVADCGRGCASCWAAWAGLEAGRLRELRRREKERAGAGERRRPQPVDLAGYALMYGAD